MEALNAPIYSAIGLILFLVLFIYLRQRQGGIKALFEKSRNAPQYWNTFIVIMLLIALFVWILVKI